MRMSDWSSDVCSSDLLRRLGIGRVYLAQRDRHGNRQRRDLADENASVILLDRTDVHGKSPQIMSPNALSGTPSLLPLLSSAVRPSRRVSAPSETRIRGLGGAFARLVDRAEQQTLGLGLMSHVPDADRPAHIIVQPRRDRKSTRLNYSH